jgi:hypothetical protein
MNAIQRSGGARGFALNALRLKQAARTLKVTKVTESSAFAVTVSGCADIHGPGADGVKEPAREKHENGAVGQHDSKLPSC